MLRVVHERAASRSLGVLLLPGLFAAGATATAAAQAPQCSTASRATRGELDVKPGDNAVGVARDAPVIVRYLGDADLDAIADSLSDDDICAGQLLCVVVDTEGADAAPGDLDTTLVRGEIQRVGAREVAFVPSRSLAARTRYAVLIARPGVALASRTDYRFRTGTGRDLEPPEFDIGKSDVRVALDDVPEGCAAPSGSKRVGLTFPGATDDGDEESIEYRAYLTAGAGVQAPELLLRRRHTSDTVFMSFLLEPERAREPLCIALKAIDGVGRVAEREPEICFDPVQRSVFEPLCSASLARPTEGTQRPRGVLLSLVPLLLLATRACRRRARFPERIA